MTLKKREYSSQEKIQEKLAELLKELNMFTEEIERVRLSDAYYKIEIFETEDKKRKFRAHLIQTKTF
ncbi:MAG: hypothetical protein CMC05_11430 [Flavobacteriaceae bacterium]|nr:hypothetical protein [Flavobacteriaceae bacterium]MBD10017.1 hypothetical protein [Flavobacteriaceae bacterium]